MKKLLIFLILSLCFVSKSFAVDTYVIAGQSNAEGRATNAKTYTGTIPSTVFKQEGVSFIPLADHTDIDRVSGGSAWPLVMSAVSDATATEVRIITTADGSTSSANWTKGQATYERCVATIIASGVTEIKGMLWYQGENDASAGTTQVVYQNRIAQMHFDMQADTGITFPLYMAKIADFHAYDMAAVRDARDYLVANYSDVYAGPDLSDAVLADETHFVSDAEISVFADAWIATLNQISNFPPITVQGPTGAAGIYSPEEIAYYNLDENLEVVSEDGLTDVSITAVGAYPQSNTHFTLNSDLNATGTALSFTGTGNVLDLNNHVITFNTSENPFVIGVDLQRVSAVGTSPFLIRGPGVIIQGSANSASVKGIRLGPGQQLKDATVIVSGEGATGVYFKQYFNPDDWFIVENCYVRQTIRGAVVSDAFTVEILKSIKAKVFNSLIVGGHVGIWASHDGETAGDTYHQLHNNIILRQFRTLGIKAPAGIQIFHQAYNDIFENIIVTEDARGIIIQGSGNHDNTVTHNLADCHYTRTTLLGAPFVENSALAFWQRRGGNNKVNDNKFQAYNASTDSLATASTAAIAVGNGSGVQPLLTGCEYLRNTMWTGYTGNQSTPPYGIFVSGTTTPTRIEDNDILSPGTDIYAGDDNSNDLTVFEALTNASYGDIATGGPRIAFCTVTGTTLQTMDNLPGPIAPSNVSTTIFYDATLIQWDWSPSRDVRGYNVYRNGIKVNTVLDGGNAWIDFSTSVANYTVTSVDYFGNESGLPVTSTGRIGGAIVNANFR